MDGIKTVLSEVLDGNGIGLSDAASLIPSYRGRGRGSPSMLLRWIAKGHRLPTGDVVKLEGVKIANRWLTTREAIGRFAGKITDATLPTEADHADETGNDVARAEGAHTILGGGRAGS